MPDHACEPGDDVVLEMRDAAHRLCQITAIGDRAIAIVPPEGTAGPQEVISPEIVVRMYFVGGMVDEPLMPPVPWDVRPGAPD